METVFAHWALKRRRLQEEKEDAGVPMRVSSCRFAPKGFHKMAAVRNGSNYSKIQVKRLRAKSPRAPCRCDVLAAGSDLSADEALGYGSLQDARKFQ